MVEPSAVPPSVITNSNNDVSASKGQTTSATTNPNSSVASPSTSASSPAGKHHDFHSVQKGVMSPPMINCSSSADDIQVGISFSDLRTPKDADDRKRHALEMRLRTVRDILKQQSEINEQILSFCGDAYRWMVEADTAMRRNNITFSAVPPPPVPHFHAAVNLLPTSTATASPTAGGRTFGVPQCGRHHQMPPDRPPSKPYTEDIRQISLPEAPGSMIMSLLGVANNRRASQHQHPTPPPPHHHHHHHHQQSMVNQQHQHKQPLMSAVPPHRPNVMPLAAMPGSSGGGPNPYHPGPPMLVGNQHAGGVHLSSFHGAGGVDWECDSEGEDYLGSGRNRTGHVGGGDGFHWPSSDGVVGIHQFRPTHGGSGMTANRGFVSVGSPGQQRNVRGGVGGVGGRRGGAVVGGGLRRTAQKNGDGGSVGSVKGPAAKKADQEGNTSSDSKVADPSSETAIESTKDISTEESAK